MRLCVLTFLALFALPVVASAQLSPGPLSGPHADLEGILSCSKCHTIGLGPRELKCSSCHTEIAERVNMKSGYHGRVVENSKGDDACVTCHNEHAGRDFELIRWPVGGKSKFDHTQTGYKLEGRHTSLQCADCHSAAHIPQTEKSKLLTKNLDRTFLGLRQECVSCHSDPHKGDLGSSCTSCHSQDSWKSSAQFDHSRTQFPLTGLHAKVSCQQCHKSNSSSSSISDGGTVRFTGLNFSECSGCHRDPHRGAFAAACTTCHSTNGWGVSMVNLRSRFDHSKTRYPLTGKHSVVSCAACHRSSDFSRTVAANRCTDCHADQHRGQFANRADRGDCASCHTVGGFNRSTFDTSAHQSTRYSLLGKHSALACEECHKKKGGLTDYHPKFESCNNCHQDAHAGQFKVRYADKCDSCHTVDGFNPSTFTLIRHRETRFNLEGAHRAVACVECHSTNGDHGLHQFLIEERACGSCHSDPHGPSATQRQCDTCHTLAAWKPASGFDHSATRFSLMGAHRTVGCSSCHGSRSSGDHLWFDGTPQQCSGCHEDIHAAQFAGRFDSADCSGCHTVLKWKPAPGFDHSQSAFPLDGAHKNVRCVLCHDQSLSIKGRQTLVYRDAPVECAKCH